MRALLVQRGLLGKRQQVAAVVAVFLFLHEEVVGVGRGVLPMAEQVLQGLRVNLDNIAELVEKEHWLLKRLLGLHLPL